MTIAATMVVLFCIATTVAITVRWFRVPYTVGLVLAGLAVGALHVLSPPVLTKELLFDAFLPGLLFEAAFNTDVRELRRVALTVTVLAVPGVVASIVLSGLGAWLLVRILTPSQHLDLLHAIVFGALVAATDPIAVVALFRSLKMPDRLTVVIEGESLLNDGTSIVLLSLLLSVVAGGTVTLAGLVLQFVIVVATGLAVGGVFGVLASRLIARIDDAMIEITVTMIAAYGSFVLAESLHGSGVIATVTAGMYCGHRTRICGMSEASKAAVATFWSYVAFALNSVVFLLIGFDVSLHDLAQVWSEVLLAYVAVLVARGGVVWSTVAGLRRLPHSIPRGWTWLLTWGGVRGALSMVLALALPADFPSRHLIVSMTFGVVLLTILVQGLSMPWLAGRLVTPRAEEA